MTLKQVKRLKVGDMVETGTGIRKWMVNGLVQEHSDGSFTLPVKHSSNYWTVTELNVSSWRRVKV